MANSSDATRRSRNRSSGRNITCCSVDGCAADLSKCREYHKRHKVCEIHSKSPVVMVGGREQRFCQQCSRFHTLSEFDEGKRSCRKRLDGHNRRRRKLHLKTGSSQTDHQVPRFALHQPSRSASRMLDTNWVNFSESDHRSLDSHCLPLQSPFLQQSKVAMDSDCAFSLLSSSSQSPNINNVVPMMYAADKIPDSMPFSLNDSLGMYPCFQSSCMPMEDGSVGRGLILEANGTKLHCQDAFQGSSKVSFEGACEASSIHWQW